jgi:hypothetical protein
MNASAADIGRARLSRTCLFFLLGFMMQQATGSGVVETKAPNIHDLSAEILERHQIAVTGVDYPFILSAVLMDQETLRFSLEYPSHPQTIGQYADGIGVAAVTSAGWLERYDPPTVSGLLIHGQRVLNTIKPGDPILDALVCFRSGKVTILPLWEEKTLRPKLELRAVQRQEQLAKEYEACLQVGPLFVKGSSNDLIDVERLAEALRNVYPSTNLDFGRKTFDSPFLAIDSKNRVWFGVTTQANLSTVAKVVAMSRADGGLGAVWATQLTPGQGGAVLVRKRPILGKSVPNSSQPIAIVARRRAKDFPRQPLTDDDMRFWALHPPRPWPQPF